MVLSAGGGWGGGMLYDTAIVTTLPGLDGDLEMFLLVYDVDTQQLMDVTWNGFSLLKTFFICFLFFTTQRLVPDSASSCSQSHTVGSGVQANGLGHRGTWGDSQVIWSE